MSCLRLDTHKGLEFNFPGVQSFSEKRKKPREKQKQKISETKTLQTVRCNWEDTKCRKPFIELEKKKTGFPQKKDNFTDHG